MAGITVELVGAERLLSGLNAAPGALATNVRSAMEASLTLIEGSARTKAPWKTGRLAGSITHRITGSGASLLGEVGPSVRYGAAVEFGSRPHWMPPGILPFPVMRAIAQRGTRKQPYLIPGFEQNRGRIETLFSQVGIKLVQRIAS